MSLQWRIALALTGLGSAAAALAGAGAYLTTARQLHRALDHDLTTRVVQIGRGPDADGGSVPRSVDESGCPPDAVIQPADAAQIVLPGGAVRVCVAGGPVLSRSGPASAGGEVWTESADGSRYRVAAAPFHEGGTIQIARSLEEIEGVLAALQHRLIVVCIGVGTVAGMAGWLLARRIVRPVERLRDTARTIATSQDLATPVGLEGSGEIRDLAESFTAMVTALATSRAQQHHLVSDASHEMRTPLTSLTTNLDLLDQFEALEAADRIDVLETIRTDVRELTHLMTELVELATDRSTEEPVCTVDLADLAAAVATRSRYRSRRSIELVITGDGTVVGRPHMLERAIGNLVENAIKYSPDDAPITVLVGPDSVEVHDEGPGIAAADQERVFERFYRADTSRTLPGSGLGLAIVKQIIDRHEGRVWVSSMPEGGTRAGFSVPGRSSG
jgi:two-component system sensor histidine kinase MprB